MQCMTTHESPRKTKYFSSKKPRLSIHKLDPRLLSFKCRAQILTCNIDCKCFRVVLVNKIAGLEIRLPQYSIENSNETARNCNRLNTAWKVQ